MSYDIAIWLLLGESASSFVFGNLFSIHKKKFFPSLAQKFSKTCFYSDESFSLRQSLEYFVLQQVFYEFLL
jgi:hypothetical protein